MISSGSSAQNSSPDIENGGFQDDENMKQDCRKESIMFAMDQKPFF